MTYQVLARKWRPRRFSELVGQEHVVRALEHAVDQDRVHHGFLFTGTRGVGKTTIARILAKCLNCEVGMSSVPCGECATCTEIDEGRYVDLIEVDAASRSGVDGTRELMDNVHYAPSRGRYKVYLIDEVHMFSTASFNALLKTLEEPPPHVKFLLATTDPQKIPVTVLSRCLQFNLKRLPRELIQAQLLKILQQESIDSDEAALRELARAADGSMRDALSLLDQAIAHGGGRLQYSDVQSMLGTLDRRHLHALLEGLQHSDAVALLERVAEMAGDATDFGQALSELIAALQRLAIIQVLPQSLAEDEPDRDWWLAKASALSPEDIQLYYQIGIISRRDMPYAPDPRSGFEMAMIRMVGFAPIDTVPGTGGGAAPGAGPRTGDSARRGTGTRQATFIPSPVQSTDAVGQPVLTGSKTGFVSELASERLGVKPAQSPQRTSRSGLDRVHPTRGQRPGSVDAAAGVVVTQGQSDSVPPHLFDVGQECSEPGEPGGGEPGASISPDALKNDREPLTHSSGAAESGQASVVKSAVANADGCDPRPFDIEAETRGNAWLNVVEALTIEGFARELALNCVLQSSDQDWVRVCLSPAHEQLNNAATVHAFQTALCGYHDRPLRLEVMLAEPDCPTPAQIRTVREQAKVAAAVQALQADPVVRHLGDTFGAELIEGSVRLHDAGPA